VIGEVQSGKTSHMASVIAKAVDASFNVVIVLAGLTDVLRNQTQDRLDKDLFAFEPTDPRNYNSLPTCIQWSKKSPKDHPSSGEVCVSTQRVEADLRRQGWILAVTKKNVRTINRLCAALENADFTDRARARVLVIDDEADSASPHAPRRPELPPTGINRAIRRLMACFPHHSYVGYTATPYAVVLANPEDVEGMYPKDFIVALPASEAYFGMARIFGAEDHPEHDGGLPWVVVEVCDEEMDRLKYRRGAPTTELTSTLRDALHYFICATAERWRRGQRAESSTMLVHTTPFTVGHRQLLQAIEVELGRIRRGIAGRDSAVMSELRQVWARETARIPEDYLGRGGLGHFEDIVDVLRDVMAKLWVCQENSVSRERIRFRDERGDPIQQVAVIVGGNVLSRGVTLEGLVVSYFGRATDLYDALSQAGRWFGYRSGYEELQRLWTTRAMEGFYRDIARIDRDIRLQVKQLAASKISPTELPVSVRTHELLRVTSPYKMWFADSVEVPIGGLRLETTVFDRGVEMQHGGGRVQSEQSQAQWKYARELFANIAPATGPRLGADGCSMVFEGAPFSAVLRFLRGYPLHPADPILQIREALMSAYARDLDSGCSFASWNIAIIGVHRDDGQPPIDLGSGLRMQRVNRSRRQRVPLQREYPNAAFIKQLSSASDVAVDLPVEEVRATTGRNALLALRKIGGRYSRPLLALYAIDKNSKPKTTEREASGNEQMYADLDASSDLLGFMLVHPVLRDEQRSGGLRGGRVAVKAADSRPLVEADAELAQEVRQQEADL
jgi:hypothetical protein